MEKSLTRLAVPILKKSQREMFNLAYTDTLTTCFNRNMLDEFRKSWRHIDDEPIYMSIVGTDDLREINDEEGHIAGDIFLKAIALHLFPRAELVFRLDSDVFLLLSSKYIALSDISRISYGTVEKKWNESFSQAMHRADETMQKQKKLKKKQMEKLRKEISYDPRNANEKSNYNSE